MTILSNEQLRENAHHLYLCAIGKYAGDPQENIQNELHDILASQLQAILKEVREGVIGEDEQDRSNRISPHSANTFSFGAGNRNALRAKQRVHLDALEKKYKGGEETPKEKI